MTAFDFLLSIFCGPSPAKEMARLYRGGMTLREVSSRVGCPPGQVREALIRHGVKLRGRGRPRKAR